VIKYEERLPEMLQLEFPQKSQPSETAANAESNNMMVEMKNANAIKYT